jgi:uncharacterized protein YjbI with pentapeptide repeats
MRELFMWNELKRCAVWIEHKCLEPLDNWLGELSFFNILDYVSKLTILLGVITFFLESGARKQQRQLQAWSLIVAASGQRADAGRKDALQSLNKDNVSLERLDAPRAPLTGIKLNNAKLNSANFDTADLRGAELNNADLSYAYLINADFSCLTFNQSSFFRKNKQITKCSNLRYADLRSARLNYANLGGADLSYADLSCSPIYEGCRDTNLKGANLTDAKLNFANLKGTELGCEPFFNNASDIRCTNLSGASLIGVKNLTEDQLEQAYLCGTTLPETLIDLFDRDCAEEYNTWRTRFKS